MTRLKHVLAEIRKGENLELYIVVAASTLLLILDLFGLAQSDWISSVTIAVLALIAVSLLGNRHRIESIQNELRQSTQGVFLTKYPDSFKSDIEKAKELWVVGANLATTTNIYFDLFADTLKRGGTIRILIIDPKNTATAMSANRILRGETEESVSAVILMSLSRMCKLRESIGDGIEIRTINYVPSFGVFGVDVESQNGVLYVEHYGYRLNDDLPKFVLRPKDENWFQLFRTQLLALWNDGTEWPHSESQTRSMIVDVVGNKDPTCDSLSNTVQRS